MQHNTMMQWQTTPGLLVSECRASLLATFLCCLIHHRRHLLRLFFGVIAALETFGAVLVEPCHNPMKLDHRTPSVSGLPLVFGFAFAFGHAQPPRSKSGSLPKFTAIRLASSLLSSLPSNQRQMLQQVIYDEVRSW